MRFSYSEEGGEVLRGVDLRLEPGAVTALVGPSGSGKSTVAKLVARFFEPDSGRVTAGGVDLATLDEESWLANVSAVFQDVTLFDDTVMENIRMGRAGATDEEVRAAARAAHCEEFVERLPEGWDTRLGENGASASRLTNHRLEELEKRVNRHNQVIERTYRLEEQVKSANHRISDLEDFHRP